MEITLNQWLDFYPGYMYVLTDNLEKVREEETKNKEAREKEGYDPGAVLPGVQAQWIQPLVIRGNQGDCVKITLRNQMESESGSLHINGGSMVISATGKDAVVSVVVGAGDEPFDVVWWDPATLHLRADPPFGLRRQELISKDVEPEVVAHGQRLEQESARHRIGRFERWELWPLVPGPHVLRERDRGHHGDVDHARSCGRPAQVAAEPARGRPGHLLQGAGFLEQVAGPRHHHQVVLAAQE